MGPPAVLSCFPGELSPVQSSPVQERGERREERGEMVNTEGHKAGPHHACLTGCALTYNSYRRGSRNFNNKELSPGQTFLSVFHVQGEFGIIKEAEEEETDTRDKSGDSADTRDTPTDSPQHQPAGPVGFNKDRRRSSFSLAKLGNDDD